MAALLEQRVSGRGDLMVQATTHTTDCAHGEGCQNSRTVALADGRKFDAHTFGRRSAMPMRSNIAIHGMALDGKLALSDLAGRVLDPAEIVMIRAQGSVLEEPCLQDAGQPHEPPGENEVFIAWDDSRTSGYCSEAHARLALEREEGVERSGRPAADAPDPDGEIAFSPMTEGQKKLLFIRVDFPDFPGQVVGDSTLGQLITDMDTAYSDMSYGKATFAALGQGSDITPPRCDCPTTRPITPAWAGVERRPHHPRRLGARQ